MFNTYKNLWKIIPFSQKKSVILISIMILLTGILDAFGVAAIIPFLNILADPNITFSNQYINAFYIYLDEPPMNKFFIIVGSLTLLFLCISIPFKAFTQYLVLKFTYRQEATLSHKLFKTYLNKNYIELVQDNTSMYETRILSEVGHIVAGGLIPGMQIIMHTVIFICITLTLIFIDPFSAVLAFVIFTALYSIIYVLLKNILYKTGIKRQEFNKLRFNTTSQVFLNLKIIKQKMFENFYAQKFKSSAEKYAKAITLQQISAQLPRFFMEIVAFSGMIIILLINISAGKDFLDFLPLIGALVFASYKLLPSSQSIYQNISTLRFNKDLISKFANEIQSSSDYKHDKNQSSKTSSRPHFSSSMKLENISFIYPNSSKKVLNKISIEIPINKKIGIVGPTGSGKSTLVDLILGLISPTSGNIFLDGSPVTLFNSPGWTNSIGFVPQKITLFDDSVKNNIAVGQTDDSIDFNNVKRAAKLAQIDEFIENDLSESYETQIGEDGINLSGGQRQRIGLARALYNSPSVLIFDEATSALDKNTEKKFFNAIFESMHDITIFFITHNIETTSECDFVLVLDDGEIVESGKFDYLIENSIFFNKLSSNESS